MQCSAVQPHKIGCIRHICFDQRNLFFKIITYIIKISRNIRKELFQPLFALIQCCFHCNRTKRIVSIYIHSTPISVELFLHFQIWEYRGWCLKSCQVKCFCHGNTCDHLISCFWDNNCCRNMFFSMKYEIRMNFIRNYLNIIFKAKCQHFRQLILGPYASKRIMWIT